VAKGRAIAATSRAAKIEARAQGTFDTWVEGAAPSCDIRQGERPARVDISHAGDERDSDPKEMP